MHSETTGAVAVTTTGIPGDEVTFDFNPLVAPHREDPHLFYPWRGPVRCS